MRRVTSSKKSSSRKPTSKLGSARRTRSFMKQSLAVFSLVVAVVIIILGFWFYHSGKSNALLNRWMAACAAPFARFAVTAGLTLENIYLEGAAHTKKETIIDALNVRMGQPILTIPLWQVKKNLEKIDWVKHAVVERQLPDSLHVRIVERQPLAMWQKSGKLYLVDEEGHIIEENNLKPFVHLLIMVGENVAPYASALLAVIKEDKALYNHIAAAVRIGERRWNIRFTEGIEVKLPEEGMEAAWQYVTKLYHEKKLFGVNINIIDLRVAEKVYMNVTPAVQQEEKKK